MSAPLGKQVTYSSFEQVAHLSTEVQERLLQGEDAIERVWAAWALGLQRGASANPQLLASLYESPDPGTRRQLLVILAGLGERQILQTFAQDDPDGFVRATACQYLIRTGIASDARVQGILLERLLYDEALVVRQTILQNVQSDLPRLDMTHLGVLAGDPELEVRQLATDKLLEMVPSSALFPGVLEERIAAESDPALRHRLVELDIAAGGGARLLTLAISSNTTLETELLTTFIQHHLFFQWAALAPLTRQADPGLDRMVLQLLDPEDALPAFSWLLDCVAATLNEPEPDTRPELEAYWLRQVRGYEARPFLAQAAKRMQADDVPPSDYVKLRQVIVELEQLEQTAASGVMEDWDYEIGAFVEIPVDWYADAKVVEQLDLLRELRRLIT